MTNRQAAIQIVRKLQDHGHQALLAGGCVRDMLLGRRAKDYDVATSARPDEVAELFRRTVKVGAKFGVIIVMLGDEKVEVATFRSEADYADGRRPTRVEYTCARQDASRRDFTINGMYYDPVADELIDYVGGKKDLDARIIRTIGQPSQRFGEDYLRMLRAVRFSAVLDFEIEAKTFAAVRHHASNITRISGERISMELEGILTHPRRARGAELLFESGLADEIFPGFSGECKSTAVKVLAQLRSRVDYPLALAGYFCGCDVDFATERVELLKLSRKQTDHLNFLLEQRGTLLDCDMRLADLKKLLAKPYFRDLYELQRAIQKSHNGGRRSLEPLIRLKQRIRELGDVELQPRRLLNGHNLIKLGATPGPEVGQLAEELYVAQLEGAVRTKEQARRWVRDWLAAHGRAKPENNK